MESRGRRNGTGEEKRLREAAHSPQSTVSTSGQGNRASSPGNLSERGVVESVQEDRRPALSRQRLAFLNPEYETHHSGHQPRPRVQDLNVADSNIEASQRPSCYQATAPPEQSFHVSHVPQPYGSHPYAPSFRYGRDNAPPPLTSYHDPNIIMTPFFSAIPGSLSVYPPHPFHLPPNPHGYPQYHWAPVRPIEYISDIKPSDVLSGRGGATNSHSGNRAFRTLVKQYQDQYLKAKKRDKPDVASTIVQNVRDKGGRFLKRVDTTSEGQVLWVDIGDERAKEKTCQALREGAPEIRRKRKVTGSTDEEDTIKTADDGGDLSLNSSFGRYTSNDEGNGSIANRTVIIRNRDTTPPDLQSHADSLPLMIRPSQALIRRRIPQAISIDQLEPHERELYLRDFLPPDPGIRRRPSVGYTLNSFPSPTARTSETASSRSIVQV